MLKLQNISAAYRKDYLILEGIDLEVFSCEKLAVLGRNGVGKTTLANAIMGLVPFRNGNIEFNNELISNYPSHKLITKGIGYFMQGGRIFPQMNIEENIRVACLHQNIAALKDNIERLKPFIPVLRERQLNTGKAGNLSGGERNQLALAMVLINKPKLLILDEPFAGMAPKNINLILGLLEDLHGNLNFTLLLIEQNQYIAKKICNKVYELRQKKLHPLLFT